ncbi:ATP-dependent helicase [Sporosarcina sp. FA15]|uniref:ATP-dependent helicase n=1 Tax=Sporosarcina sp. FA15 TaxID=3413031 RepID=UPI003F655EC9
MKIIDNLLGKTKFINEINRLNDQISSLESDNQHNENIVNDFRQKQNKWNEAMSKVDGLLKRKNELIEKMKNEIDKQRSDLTCKKNELNKQEEMILTYSELYGAIKVKDQIENDEAISEFDEDKGFFDFLKVKNGNNDFNHDQINAIRYDMKKNLRIIAGAGSGKTQTICAKAAYLVLMKNVRQENIAMLTFTNKASEEMKERVIDFLGAENTNISVGTFHSIFQNLYWELIRKFPYIESMGVKVGDPKKGENEYKKLLIKLIKKFNLKLLNEGASEKSLFEKIGYWTNMGFSYEEMTQYVEKHFNDLEESNDYPISMRFKEMMSEMNQIRKERNIGVFDDHMLNLLQALQEDNEVREYIQQRFQYIFIDEFQDTNPLQMEIIKQICPPNQEEGTKLIIVGDDDQSIYFFRGAEPKYIKEFDKMYVTHTLTLMMNYRSIASVVQAGNRVIKYNEGNRIPKDMVPFKKTEGDCFIRALNNQEEEAEWIIQQSRKLGMNQLENQDKNTADYTKSVILYRSNTQIKTMLNQLESQNIPFVIEANEDLMGIFNLNEFKKAFLNWKKFIYENDDKIFRWNQIIYQTAFSFYKNKHEVNSFFRNKGLFVKPEEAAEFICNGKNKVKKDVVITYLEDLIKLKNQEVIPVSNIIKTFLSFPLVETNLTKEEIKWIDKEAEQFKTWNEMIQRHDSLIKKKEDMKDKIKEYHKGNYNALYLLTIHKSKGLSFENVFLIGVHNEGLPSKRAKEMNLTEIQECIEKAEPPSTKQEERRLMYVAVTRPKKNLYITFPKMINGKPTKRSEFLKEINLPINQ